MLEHCAVFVAGLIEYMLSRKVDPWLLGIIGD